jgi:secreted PhoX family phosphatase
VTQIPTRRLLPMFGQTRGKRSPVTCHLKCDDACAKPAPNTTDNEYFRDIAGAAFSRRTMLAGAGAGALALVLGGQVLGAPDAAARSLPATPPLQQGGRGWGAGGLQFRPIEPVAATVDEFTVPAGYDWNALIRWGDPLFDPAETFDVANQSPARQERQFGYNNDYTDIIEIPGSRGRQALLVCNHEYTNNEIMFPASTDQSVINEQARISQAAHGMSVVHLHRSGPGKPWQYTVGSSYNRRITANTPFSVVGPIAGAPSLQTVADPAGRTVLGTIGNCAGGTTPWGTVLSGEENFNGYFRAAGASAPDVRYGLTDKASTYGWENIDIRFDARAAGSENEPNRFGWIVELDPFEPDAPPVKHTALGRFKHEGANVIVGRSGHVAAYMGDDERFDYLYKFVSKNRMRRGSRKSDRAFNKTLLTEGSLYVARFTGDSPASEIDGTGTLPADGRFDGTGEWLPIVVNGVSQVPGFSTEQALVQCRLAADQLGATKMDRCEDVEPSLRTGKVYVACTNNTDRGKAGKEGATEPNPRVANRDGHIVEITEDRGDARSTTFTWSLLLVCGDPSTNASTYFAGFPQDKVSPISCPDNLAFDSKGNLWISTDGAPGVIGYNDGLFKVPLTGRDRGHVQQFLSVPVDAETCGPVIHDRDGMVFVAVQHPGEDGTFDEQLSYFPDFIPEGAAAPTGSWRGPRPSVVQVWRS